VLYIGNNVIELDIINKKDILIDIKTMNLDIWTKDYNNIIVK
jgi:hypothetical protein